MLNTHLLDRGFLSWRMKCGIGCYEIGNLTQPVTMLFNSLY